MQLNVNLFHVHFIKNGYKRFSKTNSTDPRQRVPLRILYRNRLPCICKGNNSANCVIHTRDPTITPCFLMNRVNVKLPPLKP